MGLTGIAQNAIIWAYAKGAEDVFIGIDSWHCSWCLSGPCCNRTH